MANPLTKRVSAKFTSWVSLVALFLFLPLLLLGVNSTVTLLLRAIGKPAKIIVDTKLTQGVIDNNFYHAFAQGGEEAGDMLKTVTSQVKNLEPKLIRLDHIYDHYNVVSRSGTNLNYDFSRLDQAVNTILAVGAKPVLALSYMPKVIAKDEVIINPPNDWNEWAQVVQRTIEHYSGKNEKNLSGVYYEVWNEPDLEIFGKWKTSGEKNYLTLYRYAASGAKQANNVNRFYLGGPSTTGLYKNWIVALITSGVRIDFLSWHSYLTNPTQFNQDQQHLASWLMSYPEYILLPKLISEFGFTGGKSNLYGTNFAAAHTAAVVRQLISGGPTYLFSFQLKDGPSQQSGNGWGLITHEDNGTKLKPRYYVYNFLDNLVGNRLHLTGEGTWVTGYAAKKEQTVRVMLVNFDANGNHVETVPVTFTDLDNGSYKYRERLLTGRDSSSQESVVNGNLTKQVYLPAQSVALLELTKQ